MKQTLAKIPLPDRRSEGGVVDDRRPGWPPRQFLTKIDNKPIYRNYIKNLPYNHKLKSLASAKRKEGILCEVLFWQAVHKRKSYSIDFDRQRIIGNYIVDFYVKALGLVVEIDGSSHDEKYEYDRIREQYLLDLGLKVFRVQNSDVKKNLHGVMESLKFFIIDEFG